MTRSTRKPRAKHPFDFPGSQAAFWGSEMRVFNVMSQPEYDELAGYVVVYGWSVDSHDWDRASVGSLLPIGPVARELLKVR